MKYTLKVNGRSSDVDVDPATPLLFVLSDDLSLRGPLVPPGDGDPRLTNSGFVFAASWVPVRPGSQPRQIRRVPDGMSVVPRYAVSRLCQRTVKIVHSSASFRIRCC